MAPRRDEHSAREVVAFAIAMVVAVPLLIAFSWAMKDAAVRRTEAPLVSILGKDTYERLEAGDKTPLHYLGHDRRVPDFTLKDRSGRPWSMRDQRGKTVVLNFWSTTCPPCIEELPTLEELADVARQWPDVEVVGVSTDPGWEAVAPVVPANPAMKILFDPKQKVVQGKFGTRLFPETWIIDPKGVIRFRYDGAMDWSSPLAIDLINLYR